MRVRYSAVSWEAGIFRGFVEGGESFVVQFSTIEFGASREIAALTRDLLLPEALPIYELYGLKLWYSLQRCTWFDVIHQDIWCSPRSTYSISSTTDTRR